MYLRKNAPIFVGDNMALFTSGLERKYIVAFDGNALGKAKTMLVDEISRFVSHLVVEMFDWVDMRAFTTNNEGNFIFPFEKDQSVKDIITVKAI